MKTILISFVLSLVSFTTLAAYEDHFPVYFEYCTGTQWKLQSGELGGSPGHGFTYIHGLCKDYRSTYPQVIPCNEVSPELRARYPHEGVGISLDKNFSNVMWVAVPGRDLTLFGDSPPKAISRADIEKIIRRIGELKIFDDVVHKGEKASRLPFNSREYLDAVALETLGTDYAVNWARELHCVRIPAPHDTLEDVAKFLNQSNNQHKNKPYVWDKVSNNCAHLAINTSHAMSINESIKIDTKFLSKLNNIALPSNTFLMYADWAVLAKKPSLRLLKKNISQRGFHHVQLGSIMENHPAFPSGEYFNTEGLSVLTLPRIKKPHRLLSTPEKYEKRMTPENSHLKVNAEMWLNYYTELLSAVKSEERYSPTALYLEDQIQLAKQILAAE